MQLGRGVVVHFAGGVVGRILRGDLLIVPANEIHEVVRLEIPRPQDLTARLARSWSKDKAAIIQSVMIADRLEHLHLLVEFANSPSNLLILDRYKISGLAYGCADGLESSWLQLIQSVLPDADLTVLLDVSVEESKRRRPERRDYYETNYNKLEEVRSNYLAIFKELCDAQSGERPDESYLVVDGSLPPSKVSQKIVAAIWEKLDQLQATQESFDVH